MKKPKPTSNYSRAITLEVLESMNREELRATARHLKVPSGGATCQTRSNIAQAIIDGKAHLKAIVTISIPLSKNTFFAQTVFQKKFRTYKPDKVTVNPHSVVVR